MYFDDMHIWCHMWYLAAQQKIFTFSIIYLHDCRTKWELQWLKLLQNPVQISKLVLNKDLSSQKALGAVT